MTNEGIFYRPDQKWNLSKSWLVVDLLTASNSVLAVMDLEDRVRSYVANPTDYTGDTVVKWYDECGDDGVLVRASLIRKMLSSEARHVQWQAAARQPSTSTAAQPAFIPAYTALLANPQGGKSTGQSLCSAFSKSMLGHAVVHISTQQLPCQEFTKKLRANMEPKDVEVDQIQLVEKRLERKAVKCTHILVTACTPARLTQVAAILSNHHLWCVERNRDYKVGCCGSACNCGVGSGLNKLATFAGHDRHR